MDPVTSQPLNIALGEFLVISEPTETHYSTQFFHFGENFLAVALPLGKIELFESVRATPASFLADALEGKTPIHDALGLENAGAIVWIQKLPVRRGIPASLARVNQIQSFGVIEHVKVSGFTAKSMDVSTPVPELESPTLTEGPPKKSKSKGD